MTTRDEVERFLNQFHEKLKIYNIFLEMIGKKISKH